jgi:hypothetical protein
VDLVAYLAHWENLSLTVLAKATDDNMVYEMVASSLVRTARRYGDYIAYRQQKSNGRFCVYLLELANRWETRLRKDKGKKPYFLR